jgi:fatty acid desaturase
VTEGRDGAQERRRRQRAKNWALVAALFALVALIYAVSIVRMSGG